MKITIKLKWNKVTFDDMEIDSNDSADSFKNRVYELTGVPKDRQKLMAKGAWIGTLKDDAPNLGKITDNQLVTLMGSADVVEKPKEAVQFLEDMTADEKAQKGAVLPAGMANLGNTCYMNATVECLRHMPEIRESLRAIKGTNLAASLRETLIGLDRSGNSVPPYQIVGFLRTNYPQFSERANNGAFVQQDAEEFYNTLTQDIANKMSHEQFNSLLGLELEEELSCQEVSDEPVVSLKEYVNKLVCNIQGGVNSTIKVDHLHEGLKIGLEGTVEKHSSILGRNALWNKKQRIASLPKYICFQFMRFFWKETPESRDNQRGGVKCKILRCVSFPETIDLFELCTESLQAALRENRVAEEKEFEKSLSQKRAELTGDDSNNNNAMDVVTPPPPPTTEEDEETKALNEALKMSLQEQPAAVAIDNNNNDNVSKNKVNIPPGCTGLYELHAIVTHKGRSADSGHYIGWVRQSPGSYLWWCYDDDKVTEVRTEDIMKLNGGGDREMAYLNFYRCKDTK